MIIPGGKIIGGMGGRVYVGSLGDDENALGNFGGVNLPAAPNGEPGYLDISQWMVDREWITAQCPHSGTYGAISRRIVAFDWNFALSMPVNQDNMADRLLGFLPLTDAGNPNGINVALAFYLGDVKINPEAIAMGMAQRFYFAPAAVIRRARPVLNAVGDVIRMDVAGEGNSRLYLISDEKADCDAYIGYLKGRGWWT